jgi:integrase
MRQKTFKVAEYPNAASVKVALQSLIFTLNDPSTMNKTTPFGMVIERFIVEERLREIAAQPPGHVKEKGMAYSTAMGYLSYFKNHLQPRWGNIPIEAIRPCDVLAWIRDMSLAGLTKGHIKALMHTLFERAMLWDMLDIQRNPIDLVRIKGSGIRKKKKIILTVDQFQQLRESLSEPYKTMVTLAICTGLRVSEVTALRWEHITDGALLVQAGSFHGRIGAVKTQASADEIPLHPDILGDMVPCVSGLVFPSPVTGGPFHGGRIQQGVLRPLGRKIGIGDNLGWHTLRHTYRSLLDDAPVGVQQKLMRHANVSTTMNVYGNSMMTAKREANSKVVQMVVGRAS